MALINKFFTFTAGGSIIASAHNTNFNTIYQEFNGSISNANISGSAAIADTKLAQITTGSKVSAASLTALSSLPAAAGNLPSANMPDKVVLSATDTVTELTIASGVITATQSYHIVDTEGDAASDSLDTISGGTEGMILVLGAASSARTVTATDGSGNLRLSANFDMDHVRDKLMLIYSNSDSSWHEIARSNNAA